MRNPVIQSEIIDGTTTIREYKGTIIPYFDFQMLMMVVLFGLGLYFIMRFNNQGNKKKNIQISLAASALFMALLYWYSLPEGLFYTLIGWK
jgi:hypothetical protein